MTAESGFDRAPGRGAIFDVLDAASALLGAPLIFEDAELNVVAWSAGQATADPERLASIVDRRPEPARSLHLHPNTFRYRMRRITELTGFDPRDREQRFAADLHLRLSDLDGPVGA